MAWSETNPMKERVLFIDDLESNLYTMTELCEQYGISRKTGYKWAERYVAEGLEGLKDRSRAPKSCSHSTDQRVVEALLACRRQHPHWGPRKLLRYLHRREPSWPWPAPSTAGDILKRHGLVPSRRRRRRHPHPGRPRYEAAAANDLWSTDFKGQFRTGDRRYCYPLTLADRFSRFLLGCEGLPSTSYVGVRPVMESIFREYGLPQAILSDNGPPFSSTGLGGLSRLSVWWIRLGIRPVLIEPGRPDQNGGHERMHRTLKEETVLPPAEDFVAQQQRFDAFREEFNEQRPHEALHHQTPVEFYEVSSRSYPEPLPEMEYPGHYEVRRVRQSGEIKWKGRRLYVSEALSGESVGLEETANGIWSLSFGTRLLARFDERDGRFQSCPRYERKSKKAEDQRQSK